jgi:CRISPR-associated protein Cmr2
VALLNDLRDFLADEGVSRRAVYHTLEWLKEQDLPAPQGDGEMLKTLLAYQLDRQTDKSAKDAKAKVPGLAQRLTDLTLAQPEERDRIPWLRNFLSVAEFLARETRAGGDA